MSYRIVFSDIDGTLLNSEHQLTETTRGTIAALGEKGIPFVLASARMPAGIFPFVSALGRACPMIAYSGALVLDSAGEPLYEAALPDADAQEILFCLNRSFPSLCCCLYSGNRWLVQDAADPWVIFERNVTGLTPLPLSDCDRIPKWHKLMCMGQASLIDSAAAALAREFPGIGLCKSKDTFLEIQSPQASKGRGLREVCRVCGIDPVQAVAFGDFGNDADMLRAAGLGIAMGNASEEIKSVAARIAPDNDSDGLAAVLAELFGL